MRSQRRWIGGGHDGQVKVLREMMRNAIETIDNERAHRARGRLPLAVHELVEYERAIRRGEQLTQAERARRSVASVQIPRPLDEGIVRDARTLWQLAAQLSHPFALHP